MAHLKYPKKQNISMSNMIFDLYDKAKSSADEEIIFDLSNTESLSPFGISMIAITIVECLRLKKACKYIKPENKNLKKKLKEIGFNNLFGFQEKSAPKDLITSGKIQLKKLDGLDPLFLETIAEILDYHLKISQELKWSLRMSITEATQNVVEHSGGTIYYVCSWLHPKEHKLRICIADMGKGILESFKTSLNSKHEHLEDHNKAIRMATEEGVTSKVKAAGLGLHHIKGFLSVNKGKMCIISGKGKVVWDFSRGEVKDQSMKCDFSGTILKLVINTGKEYGYCLASEEEPIF